MDEKGLSLERLHLTKNVIVESPKNQLLLMTLPEVTLSTASPRCAPQCDTQVTAPSWRAKLVH